MNAFLSTPARWNITDAAIISSFGVWNVGAPARCATSASPVASMTRAAADRLATGLRLGDDAGDRVAVHDRRSEGAVQHAADARLLDQACRRPA